MLSSGDGEDLSTDIDLFASVAASADDTEETTDDISDGGSEETSDGTVNSAPATQCSVDFSQPNIVTSNARVSKSQGTTYNDTYGNSWVLRCRGNSWSSGDYIRLNAFLECANPTLQITHLTAAVASGRNGGYGPVRIMVNNKVLEGGYDVAEHHNGSHGWETDTWSLSEFAEQGWVDLSIQLIGASGACSCYWINRLSIVCGE